MIRVNEDGLIEKISFEDGKMHVQRTNPDVSSLIRRNHEMAADAPSMHGDAAYRYVGSIDAVMAEQWSRECGAGVGTTEWSAYVKKKLQSGEFSKFLVKGF